MYGYVNQLMNHMMLIESELPQETVECNLEASLTDLNLF